MKTRPKGVKSFVWITQLSTSKAQFSFYDSETIPNRIFNST